MKILLILILVTIVILLAKAFCQQYIDRYVFYDNMLNFVRSLDINICFQKSKLGNVLQKQNADGYYKIFVNEYMDFIKNDKRCQFDKLSILTNEERNYLLDMVNALGRNDLENEVKQLETHKKVFEKKLDEVTKIKNSKVPMIMKLSVMLALLLAILFI